MTKLKSEDKIIFRQAIPNTSLQTYDDKACNQAKLFLNNNNIAHRDAFGRDFPTL